MRKISSKGFGKKIYSMIDSLMFKVDQAGKTATKHVIAVISFYDENDYSITYNKDNSLKYATVDITKSAVIVLIENATYEVAKKQFFLSVGQYAYHNNRPYHSNLLKHLMMQEQRAFLASL